DRNRRCGQASRLRLRGSAVPTEGQTMKVVIRLIVVLLMLAISGGQAFAQTPGTGRVMRQKLGHSQKILEAILTSNFPLLTNESAALAKITDLPAWTVLKGPEYMKQSEAFLKA